MSKIKLYILAIVSGLTALIALFLKAINMGKKQEKAKQTNEVLTNVKKVKKLVNSINNNDRNRLRKKYNRK